MNNKATVAHGDRSTMGRKWLPMALIVALVFVTYSITLTSRFGLLDDYAFLQHGIMGSDATFDLLVGAGRPLNAWLLDVGFAAAGSIDNLALLRFVTLTGIALLGCALYGFSRAHGLSCAASASIGAGVVLLPSFQVYAAWAQHFTTPFAAVLSVAAAYLLTPAHAPARRPGAGAILLSALLLAAALWMYQPTAMFFCTAVLISVLASPQPLRDWSVSRLVCASLAFGVAMLAAYAALKFGQQLFPNGSSRYGLLSDPLGKAAWFMREPLWNALSMFAVLGSKAIVGTCIFLIGAGFVFRSLRLGARTGTYTLVLWILGLLGSYLPNLATGENWASYRSIGALAASIVVTVAVLVVEPLSRRLAQAGPSGRWRLVREASRLGALVLSVYLVICAQKTVTQALVLPNVAEIDNLSQLFRMKAEEDADEVTTITVRPSAWTDSAALPMAYDEFGMQSSINPQYASAIVDIVRKSLDVFQDADIAVIDRESTLAPPAGKAMLHVDFATLASAGKYRAVRAPVNSGKTISLAAITDYNWTNGIWTNPERPADYSFVFRRAENGTVLRPGDRVKLAHSGERAVVKVDRYAGFSNVLVDGPPLVPADGHPAVVLVARRTVPHP